MCIRDSFFSCAMKNLLIALLVISAVSAFTFPPNNVPADILPENLDYYPANQKFVVGSISLGTLYWVDNTGATTLLGDTGTRMSTNGVYIDASAGVVYTVVTNITSVSVLWAGLPLIGPFYSSLVSFNLTNGSLIRSVPIFQDGPFYCNDLTMDLQKNVYISDALAAKIWMVNPAGDLSVFASEPVKWNNGSLGINGIFFHKDHIFVTTCEFAVKNRIFKISVSNKTVVEVPYTGASIHNSDGIAFDSKDRLYITSGYDKITYLLQPDNVQWSSAKVIGFYNFTAGYPDYSAAGVKVIGDQPWILHNNWVNRSLPNHLTPANFTLYNPATSATGSGSASGTGSGSGTGTGADSSASFISFAAILLIVFVSL
eukprot:TRINITY_DN101_c0_g1_i1.p1 TRINITY_DN101_c0_g1~~TRINITY_DN101_c0_g1_i1.p1  ORF type:complete len:371 (+),score=88.11 TRINITY_DN101_c0_g1_i1:64-1176(+)